MKALIPVLALGLLAPGLATASKSVFSEARASLLAGNTWIAPADGTVWTNYEWQAETAATASLGADRQFELTDALGASVITDFSHNATATANYGALSVRASVNVHNPQVRGDRPLYADWDGSAYPVQTGGVPDGYGAEAYARMVDTVQLGNASASSVRFRLQLDGTLGGMMPALRSIFMPSASLQLDQRDHGLGGRWSNVYYASTQPTFDSASDTWNMPTALVDTSVWSNPFVVKDGKVVFEFSLDARAAVSDLSGFGTSGGSFSADADFFHTLRVVDVQGFDAAGTVVALGQVVGESGAVYAMAPVPEPGTWAMLLAGGLLLSAHQRRAAKRG